MIHRLYRHDSMMRDEYTQTVSKGFDCVVPGLETGWISIIVIQYKLGDQSYYRNRCKYTRPVPDSQTGVIDEWDSRWNGRTVSSLSGADS